MTAGGYPRLQLAIFGVLAVIPVVSGCAGVSKWYSPQKLNQGYTVVLPGILGRGPWDHCLASNLDSELGTAVEIVDWTHGPLVFIYNGMSRKYNTDQAQKIANRIVGYRAQYPGRPVYLVGHSGGASLAVRVLEELPPGERVNTVVLLGCGLERKYDLSNALNHTEAGVHNYYSHLDVLISQLYSPFTHILAGRLRLTAGAFGFVEPEEIANHQRRCYSEQLLQHKYCYDMFRTGHLGGHFGWTWGPFVRKELAPVLAEAGPTNRSPTSDAQPVTFVVTDQKPLWQR